ARRPSFPPPPPPPAPAPAPPPPNPPPPPPPPGGGGAPAPPRSQCGDRHYAFSVSARKPLWWTIIHGMWIGMS
ncbi:hypothetical protein, partial [Nocardia abscessus]|uniref:hypothetical protein n=1 Tax=Nocardia abscessus TaxID=120957 RepID=UPI0024555493